MDNNGELIVGETTIILQPDKIMFFPTPHNNNAFATFYIPCQFKDEAIEFYDLYMVQGYPTVFLACRMEYDIAIRLNAQEGNMIDWHYTK